MKYLSVDRIEGNIAVCLDDDEKKYHIPLCDVDLAQPVEEGDILLLTPEGKLLPAPDEKIRRQQKNLELLRKLTGRG